MKIITKTEKDLQARVKSINSILGDNAKQTELSRSKLASIVSATIMDKCQQFIDEVSELRFLKIKGRQVNKFNRLWLKKQGNITWFSAVPLVNPWAGNTSPGWLAPLSPRQVVPGKTALLRLPAPLPQAVSSQAVSSPQAVSSWEDSASQAASASSPQTVSSQAVSSFQAVSTGSPGGQHFCPPRQVVPRKIALLRQPAHLPKHTTLTPRELALLSPRLPKLVDSPTVLIPLGISKRQLIGKSQP